jgi:hypothetical protein
MGLVKLCVKRITPFWFHVPPRTPDIENKVWGGPPETSTFLRPASTNATYRPSGDQNGFVQYSVPGIICALNESKERIQSEFFPFLPETNAIRERSGEIAKALRSVFSGISTENFNGFSSVLFCSHRKKEKKAGEKKQSGNRLPQTESAKALLRPAFHSGSSFGDPFQLQHDIVRRLPAVLRILGKTVLYQTIKCRGRKWLNRR